MIRPLLLASVLSLFRLLAVAAEPIEVSFMGGYDPDTPDGPLTRQILAFAAEHPELRPVKWGGLTLPGAGGRAPFMLAMAGGTAPDVYYCWFHIIRHDIDQGFLHPLNAWVGDDLDGDGQIGDDEARWPGWRAVPDLWRRVATRDGKVYGLPFAGVDYYGIVYRKDLVAQAGLDPEAVPETWDEFHRWCQRLTFPRREVAGARVRRGQRGFGASPAPWNWLPWMQAAGGSPVVQVKVSPKTGRSHVFAMEETVFRVPETGEDLSQVPGVWQAAFDSPEAREAARFLQRLTWAPWLRDPLTGEPVDLAEADLAAGRVRVGDRTVVFAPGDVIRGVTRPLPILDTECFLLGEIVAFFAGAEQVEQFTRDLNLPPDRIGIMPFPAARPGLKSVLQVHKHFYGMTAQAGQRPPAERDAIFACLGQVASEAVNDAAVRQKVMEGQARWCLPRDLARLGLAEHLADVPPGIRRVYDRLERGEIVGRTEPFAGFWQGVSDLLQRRVLERVLAEDGATFDTDAALASVTADANRGLMFRASETELARRRPTARVVLGIVVIVLLVCGRLILNEQRAAARAAVPAAARRSPLVAWLMLAPALVSIALWSYYPLLRGTLMAFQDYRIVGQTTWAGLDNIILVATDGGFWAAVGRTLKFVGLTLTLGFLVPVVLAVLLAEIPRGKVFFRTVYFLPHLTSALVVTLLWRMMYDPTENGMLNQLLAGFGLPRMAWLHDPAWAMICCILPGVWAGAGMASLIYVAALQALPPDYYEAAAMDGAGLRARLRHVMLPQILPLMVINFVGAFIAAFQGMGSIFLLTFGGPGDATTVVSLAIWKEAYNNLRFGTATTMAWFLGVGLIGFTWLQIRILRRVEFRRAASN